MYMVTENGGYYEYGLADASDQNDFEVKLMSLEQRWESLCPGFYNWFVQKRKQFFIDSVIQSAREGNNTKYFIVYCNEHAVCVFLFFIYTFLFLRSFLRSG